MPSLKDFVAALQAGWLPAVAALVGSLLVLAGDQYDLPYLENAPKWLTTTAAYTGVFAFSILLANIANLPVLLWNEFQKRRRRKLYLESVWRTVQEVPPQEQTILAYLFSSKRRAFVAEFNDSRLAPMVSKGMIKKLSGSHSILEWPYVVDSDVWEYLLENKEHFIINNVNEMQDPFSQHNNW